jgi:hypothetical protein
MRLGLGGTQSTTRSRPGRTVTAFVAAALMLIGLLHDRSAAPAPSTTVTTK